MQGIQDWTDHPCSRTRLQGEPASPLACARSKTDRLAGGIDRRWQVQSAEASSFAGCYLNNNRKRTITAKPKPISLCSKRNSACSRGSTFCMHKLKGGQRIPAVLRNPWRGTIALTTRETRAYHLEGYVRTCGTPYQLRRTSPPFSAPRYPPTTEAAFYRLVTVWLPRGFCSSTGSCAASRGSHPMWRESLIFLAGVAATTNEPGSRNHGSSWGSSTRMRRLGEPTV